MAFNILDMVQEYITPDNIGALAGMLGEDEQKTTSGVTGAVPAILGGLLGTFGKQEGRDVFGSAVDAADDGFLDDIAGMLGGSGRGSLISSGLSVLSSLFGDSKLGTLAGAISGFSGLSSGSSKSLLGVVVPLILGMLSRKKKQDGLDMGGLIDMLTGQKDNISKGIPKDLGKALGGEGILDDLIDFGDDAPAPTAMPQRARPKKSMFSRLLPLVIFAAVAWYAMQYFGKPKPAEQTAGPVTAPMEQARQVEERVPDVPKEMPEALGDALMVDNIDLGQEMTALFDEAANTLVGVTDVRSAGEAAERLGKINQALDMVTTLAVKLPAEGRQTLAGMVGELAPSLDRAMEAAFKVPGAADILGENANALVQKLSGLADS